MTGRIAIIGAGVSGLTATKNVKEAGFSDIVCYERRAVVGGLWYYTDQKAVWPDEACVNRSTVINTSKEFTAFSDYPMPDWYPNFCHNEEIEDYFIDYMKHFGVDKYIKFNCEVTHLTKHSTYNSTGRWQLQVKNHKTGEESTEVFDFVLVCNGHHGEPHMPKFPGVENFKGEIMHSKEYKDVTGYQNKRCVVIGIGNSGADVCVELSKYCKTFLATRRGAWVMTKLVDFGLPWDVFAHNRYDLIKNRWLPKSYLNNKLKRLMNSRMDHDMFAITPDHEPGSTHPTANDELPIRISSGRLVVKPNIASFKENGVRFEDGTFEDNIDLVVFCTGYKIGYKFIDKSVIDVQNNLVSMYKHMFIPDLPRQTLAFLAVVQPLGSMFPVAEMQSRLAARVFKGEVSLPSPNEMRQDIQSHKDANKGRYVDSQRHTIQADWLPLMDELATLTGCKPNLWKLFFTDPTLFRALMFGPGVPYQFRLEGPNAWPGARDAILTTMDRIYKPFNTRQVRTRQGYETCQSGSYLTKLSLLVGLAAAGLFYARRNNIDVMEYANDYILKYVR